MDLPPPPVSVVVVEAARLPPSQADRPFSVVTVGGEAIATAPRLDEALVSTPGVQLFRRTSSQASNPTTQGVGVRAIAGSGASRALVTLDGVPQNDPFGGWVIWSGLPVIGIEQARIVRGAGAGPYGAGALTGVIELAGRTAVSSGGEYDVYAGERGLFGAAAAAAAGDFFVTATHEKSDGWIPVREGRTAVDAPLSFRASSAAVRWSPDVGGRHLSVRLSGYQETRGSGLIGAHARALGAGLSATLAETGTGDGWRLQGWANRSDLENRSAGRNGVVTNDQYATPAWGAGVNAALRRETGDGGWEVGADVRAATGETRERFGGGLAETRIGGGSQSVAGLYAEGHRQFGGWLLTGGGRLDRWSTFDGEQFETGPDAVDARPADRSGWVPTARVGARRDLDAVHVRGAAYAGFRAPTLNELYRPFVLPTTRTLANAALEPERLYGVEFGGGGEGVLRWDATVFHNRLEDAIVNATIAPGVNERQNAGVVEATGIEAEVEKRWGEAFALMLAGAYTHARLDGEGRPPQTPELSLSGAATWRPVQPLNLRLTVRYEGGRYEDDANTRKLDPFVDVGLRADWRVNRQVTLYGAAENLGDAGIETAHAFGGLRSYDAPRTLRVGLVLTP